MREPSYIRIFKVLGNGQWHPKSDFVRPYSADLRRLQEMRNPLHFIEYEEREIRKDKQVYFTEYRIIRVYDEFWTYFRKFETTVMTPNGQMEFANAL